MRRLNAVTWFLILKKIKLTTNHENLGEFFKKRNIKRTTLIIYWIGIKRWRV